MSLNVVVASGTVKSLAMRFDQSAKPELRWTNMAKTSFTYLGS
jgi:hypothetical protein